MTEINVVPDTAKLFNRFRGYYPVVIDLETGGFNAHTDAVLEMAAVLLRMDDDGWLVPWDTIHCHIEPFMGSQLNSRALAFNRIDPYNPAREAINERQALQKLFDKVTVSMYEANCNKAIIVAHNAIFDYNFLTAMVERTQFTDSPFHPFVTFDTAALSGLVLGQTVLAKACNAAEIHFDLSKAHSARYDAEQTAKLFCELVNRWKRLGGWPLNAFNAGATNTK